MKITIGILAWNEEAHIVDTLESLFGQTLITQPLHMVEIICVPNGSTDHTAQLADHFFRTHSTSAHCFVRAVTATGKANAWNLLVHQFADPMTDLFFFMDADIQFCHSNTLSLMVEALNEHPGAQVSTDEPIKHLRFKTRQTFFDRIQQGIGQMTAEAKMQLCGQLYCMRGVFARRVWLPIGLLIEDGFLKDMVVTDLFTKAPDSGTIVRASQASHLFTAYTSLREIFRQQARQAVGQSIHYVLKGWLQEQIAKKQLSLSDLIRQRNQSDPKWLFTLMRSYQKNHRWLLYPGCLTQRFRKWRSLSLTKKIPLFPVALLAFLFDLPVFCFAQYQLTHLEEVQQLWRKT